MSNQNITNTILQIGKDIISMYEEIKEKIVIIEEKRNNINFEYCDNINDFKFYNSLINDTSFFYKKSSHIRYKKLVIDFRKHVNYLQLDSVLNYNYEFNIDILQDAITEFNNIMENNNSNNNLRWMKKIYKYNDWLNTLKSLLLYHKLLIQSLRDSFICQIKYFQINRSALPDETLENSRYCFRCNSECECNNPDSNNANDENTNNDDTDN